MELATAEALRRGLPALKRAEPAGGRLRESGAAVVRSDQGFHETSGSALDGQTRRFMQHRFGRDFSRVRVHSGPGAARSAASLGAEAYASGTDIVFASGRYRPHTLGGRLLLAHELAHVVQQDTQAQTGEASPAEAAELEASDAAGRVMGPGDGVQGRTARTASTGDVQRQTPAAAKADEKKTGVAKSTTIVVPVTIPPPSTTTPPAPAGPAAKPAKDPAAAAAAVKAPKPSAETSPPATVAKTATKAPTPAPKAPAKPAEPATDDGPPRFGIDVTGSVGSTLGAVDTYDPNKPDTPRAPSGRPGFDPKAGDVGGGVGVSLLARDFNATHVGRFNIVHEPGGSVGLGISGTPHGITLSPGIGGGMDVFHYQVKKAVGLIDWHALSAQAYANLGIPISTDSTPSANPSLSYGGGLGSGLELHPGKQNRFSVSAVLLTTVGGVTDLKTLQTVPAFAATGNIVFTFNVLNP